MSQKIVIGGATHIVGGRASHFLTRVAAWREVDPTRADELMYGGAPDDVDSDEEMDNLAPSLSRADFENLVRASGVTVSLKSALEELHRAICRRLVRDIAKVVLAKGADPPYFDPKVDILGNFSQDRYTEFARGIGFHFAKHDMITPGRYEDTTATEPDMRYAMWLLKNMRFQNWRTEDAPDDTFRGWCPSYPQERMKQLLKFPRDIFGITLPPITFPAPFVLSDGSPEDNLLAYERYCTELIVAINAVAEQVANS